MKSMPWCREAAISFAGAMVICAVASTIVQAQYRSPLECAPSDCTLSPDLPRAPVDPRYPQPDQPQTAEPQLPDLAEEQFASLGGDTISLVDSAPNVIGDFFAGGCTPATLIGPTISQSIVSFNNPNLLTSISGDPSDFIASGPIDQDVVQDLVAVGGTRPGTFVAELTGELRDGEIPIYAVRPVYSVCIPTPGAAIGRIKLADNNSPMPRDRVFFDYNYFHNTSVNGIDVNRYTPGFEKTFFNGVTSIEMRMPMAGTLDSNVVINDFTGVDQTGLNGEFGDLFFSFKALLAASDRHAISAGFGVTAPTADDVRVNLSNGTALALVENEAVYLSPFAAFLVTPTPQTFFQGFVQYNVDVSGNPVHFNSVGAGLAPVGRLDEQALLFVDLSLGRWIFRDLSGPPRGLALMIEAHYAATVDDADTISAGLFQLGDPTFDLDVLNLTLGAHALVGQSVFTLGYNVPVTDDRVFDGELRAFVNRYF